MKKEPDLFMKITVIVFLMLGAAIFILLIYYGIMDVPNKTTPDYVEYDIKELKKVPKSLITYTEYRTIAVPGEFLYGITLTKKNQIVVSADSRLLFFDRGEGEPNTIELPQPARCLASGEHGLIYTGMQDHVEVYTSEGEQADIWAGLGNKALITSLAVGDGHVFVADAGNKLIMHYNTEGRLINILGHEDRSNGFEGFIVPSPYFDVAIAPEDNLWVVNPGKRTIICFTFDGIPLESWGNSSPAVDGFSGCCNPTHIALSHKGTLFTSEKGLVRVKEYLLTGELLAIVASPAEFTDDTVGLDLAVGEDGDVYVLDPKKKAVRIFKTSGGTDE